MTKRVISLDLWGTIFDFRSEMKGSEIRRGIINDFAVRRGLDNPRMVEVTYKQTAEHFYKTYETESVTLTPRERLTHQLKLMKLEPGGEDFEKLLTDVQSAITQGPPPLAPNLKHALGELASRYRLVVVSDTGFSPGVVIRKIFKTYGIEKYFEDYSFSDENGKSKPDAHAFMSVLERVDGDPMRLWHIGDTERTDITGAHRIGGRACLYTGLLDRKPYSTKADFIMHDWKEISRLIDVIERE